VFIALESGRALDFKQLPGESAISVITLGELQAGVLAAADSATRARRLATLDAVSDVVVLPIDEPVALAWARIRAALAEAGRRVNVNDSWVAATALTHQLPVVTQDADFEPLVDLVGLAVVSA
jgi:predicted nucleic acid-binding protein